MRKRPRIAVVIPAYQAGRTLPALLDGLLSFSDPRDVIVIDDGSDDDTAESAARAGVNVIRHARNQGKGAALRHGYAHAIIGGYGAAVTLDADGQHPPRLLPLLAAEWQRAGCGIVIASRQRAFATMPFDRALSNRITTVVVSLLAGARIEDSQCGCRLVATDVLRKLTPASQRFAMESELLVQAGRAGVRIGHIDVEARPGPDSHIRHLADTLRFVAMCLRQLWV
ncbi:MAG TPA: glycosyltransferase family 2 protein [Candidatus Edwardsbacteria bacterium]|nr:glycosyltransferase family 2 protein [Candidatus Edwardsbacteria bacterium]